MEKLTLLDKNIKEGRSSVYFLLMLLIMCQFLLLSKVAYICIFSFFFCILFRHGLSQEISYSSLCYIIGLCCLPILNVRGTGILFAISWAAPVAYGGSQARGLIGAIAAGLHHSHSNVGSYPHLQPTPQLTATPDP